MLKIKEIALKVYKSWLWLILPLLILDQATKMWAYHGAWDITLIPNFLHLTTVRNTGAAWSLLSGNMVLLALVSGVMGILIIVARVYYNNKLSPLKKALFAVILAGTWGNFIDRAFYKLMLGSEGVVDFIHFQFGSYHFPIFNVADICLTLGIITFAVVLAIEDYKSNKRPKVKESNDESDHHTPNREE